MKYRKFWVALGLKIRERRRRAGRSQKGLARDLDIPRPSFSLIESGGRTIDAAELVRICNVLGMTLELLLEEALNVDPTPKHPWFSPESGKAEGSDE